MYASVKSKNSNVQVPMFAPISRNMPPWLLSATGACHRRLKSIQSYQCPTLRILSLIQSPSGAKHMVEFFRGTLLYLSPPMEQFPPIPGLLSGIGGRSGVHSNPMWLAFMLAWFARIGRNSEEFDRVRLRHSQQSARKSTAQQYVLGIVLLPADLRIDHCWEPVYRGPVKSSVNGHTVHCVRNGQCAYCQQLLSIGIILSFVQLISYVSRTRDTVPPPAPWPLPWPPRARGR